MTTSGRQAPGTRQAYHHSGTRPPGNRSPGRQWAERLRGRAPAKRYDAPRWPAPDGLQLHTTKVKGRMAGDVLEVCIGAKQLRSDVEARLGDDTVHRSAYGNTPATQRTVQEGR